MIKGKEIHSIFFFSWALKAAADYEANEDETRFQTQRIA